MPTEKQIEANRQNSQPSTGATTPEGKQRSSQNALKRGYTGKTLVLSESEQEPYTAHVASFTANYAPADGVESNLCSQLADIHWSIQQISVDLADMNATLSEASAELRAQGATALARAAALAAIDVENRLLAMQSARKEAAKVDLLAAVHQHQLHKAKDLPWVPADGGFVCSLEEVQAYISRYNLEFEAKMLSRLAANPNDPALQAFKAPLKTLPR
jgi:hypothetical protein